MVKNCRYSRFCSRWVSRSMGNNVRGYTMRMMSNCRGYTDNCWGNTVDAFACSRPKSLKKFQSNTPSRWGREHTLAVRTRTHPRGEEPQLGSGWILIRAELSSPNFNIAKNRTIICDLVACLQEPWHLPKLLSVADRDRKWKMVFWIALLCSAVEHFSRFRDRNQFRLRNLLNCTRARWVKVGRGQLWSDHSPSRTQHANAPIVGGHLTEDVPYRRRACNRGHTVMWVGM